MTLKVKILLLMLGIILGILLSFGASDFEIILKDKTQVQKDLFNIIARASTVISISVFILVILKKIHVRPTWSYFVMGISATYSIMNFVILPLLPKLLYH